MEKITFMEALLWFWMKGTIYFEQNMVKLVDPHFILKIIPTGSKKKNIPINQISSVETNFKLKLGTLLLGIILFIMAVSMLTAKDGFVAFVIFLLLAINEIVSAFESKLTITLSSGEEVATEFFIFERGKAETAANNINQLIASK